MIPSWFRKKLIESLTVIPDEQCEAAFRAGKLAAGFSREELCNLREQLFIFAPSSTTTAFPPAAKHSGNQLDQLQWGTLDR
jgi:hypothetical protein